MGMGILVKFLDGLTGLNVDKVNQEVGDPFPLPLSILEPRS
jgi:hypothetical protein